MEFNAVVILICFAFAVFLIFKEIKRGNKSRLIYRLLASVLMVMCFALLIIPITYSIKKVEAAHELNLLTEGTSLAAIANIKGPKYDLDSTLFPTRKNLKITHLADLDYHLAANPAVKKINVYGFGLSEQALQKLKAYQVNFHAAFAPSGVISASWQRKLNVTANLKIQGIYNNNTSKAVKLLLYGMGKSLDSIEIKSNSKISFSFNNQPKQVGKAVFNLIALQNNDTLSIEPIPFEVESKQPLKVLILASFPDFEYKFLKKWLYENEYSVVVRTQISKNKYSTDFLNRTAINVNQLNQALLKNIDLVIIDEDELYGVPNADKASIYGAVSNGLGLIVRVTNPNRNAQNFNQYVATSTTEKPLALKSPDNLTFNNLPFKQTLFLKSGANDQPLVMDETGKIVVNSQISGMGKILTSTVLSTYQWQLAGKKYDYARFWSLLFAESSRKKIEAQSFNLIPQFPAIAEKVRLMVSLSDSKRPMISIDNTKINPRQNMEIPFEWDGFFWSKTAGWRILSINQKIENIYFYKSTDWSNAKNFNKINTTTNFVANQAVKDFKDNKINYLAKETVSKWWFFSGFLLTISLLWYEQRYLANK